MDESKPQEMLQSIQISTPSRNGLYNITRQVDANDAESAAGGPAWSMYMSRGHNRDHDINQIHVPALRFKSWSLNLLYSEKFLFSKESSDGDFALIL